MIKFLINMEINKDVLQDQLDRQRWKKNNFYGREFEKSFIFI